MPTFDPQREQENIQPMSGTATDNQNRRPYRQILKSTFIMGGSSVIISLLGMVRTKIIALILGPTGIGLTGIYLTITDLVRTVAGVGIRESGVRQIAGAVGTGDQQAISRTLLTVRRAAMISGGIGLLAMALLSGDLSRLTFGNDRRNFDLAILSIAVLFAAISAGQAAVIQGVRRINDLAKLGIFGALAGTVFSIPIVYVFGERGIAYSLIMVAVTNILTSWWYSRKIDVPAVTLTWRETLVEGKPLLKLGFALMLGSLMIVGTQYLLRVLVVRQTGLEAAGIFQASTTLSSVYVGVILNAMMTDFYPRLSAAAHDDRECTTLINDQVEVGLLLAVPGIMAIMTCAPLVIMLFYSAKFMPAVEVLRWQITGVMLQVVSWPMGFMLRAKGAGKLFFATELTANGAYLLFAWLGMASFGVTGIGMAFLAMNVTYAVLIFTVVRRYYGFTPSGTNIRLLSVFTTATAVVFAGPYLLPTQGALAMNLVITVAVTVLALRQIVKRSATERVPALFLKLKARFSFSGSR